MKSLLLLAFVSLGVSVASAQPGTVLFVNSHDTLITTNATAIGGGTGPTSPDPGGFIYGLFTAPFGTVNPNLISGPWTFSGVYATNLTIALPGRLNGGGPVSVPTWPDGATNDFIVAGWSSNLGLTWSAVAPQLATGNWVDFSGFFGQSPIGFGIAGGSVSGIPAFNLFGPVPNAQGTPSPGFDLFSVVPEPSALALLALGGAGLLARRRRNTRKLNPGYGRKIFTADVADVADVADNTDGE